MRFDDYTERVKGGDTCHTSRNEVQIGFSVNPQSRFVFLLEGPQTETFRNLSICYNKLNKLTECFFFFAFFFI